MHELMSISRLRMGTEGAGISTLVGFYGCPLQCRYCINKACHDEHTIRAVFDTKELYYRLCIDSIYFTMTGGGVVFGGGEPLPHSEYIHQFAGHVDHAWALRIETSLHAGWEHVERLVGDIDEWIIDIKSLDPAVYHAYTGQDNGIVRDNLKRLMNLVEGEKIRVRVPLIPDFNTSADVGHSVQRLQSYGVKIESFTYILPKETVDDEEAEE